MELSEQSDQIMLLSEEARTGLDPLAGHDAACTLLSRGECEFSQPTGHMPSIDI